jgi:hypothetical protein
LETVQVDGTGIAACNYYPSALPPSANANMRPPQPLEETRKLTAVDVALLIAIAAMTGDGSVL